jgi:hypothetical protein
MSGFQCHQLVTCITPVFMHSTGFIHLGTGNLTFAFSNPISQAYNYRALLGGRPRPQVDSGRGYSLCRRRTQTLSHQAQAQREPYLWHSLPSLWAAPGINPTASTAKRPGDSRFSPPWIRNNTGFFSTEAIPAGRGESSAVLRFVFH